MRSKRTKFDWEKTRIDESVILEDGSHTKAFHLTVKEVDLDNGLKHKISLKDILTGYQASWYKTYSTLRSLKEYLEHKFQDEPDLADKLIELIDNQKNHLYPDAWLKYHKEESEKFEKRVQKQFDEIKQAYINAGYPKDAEKMNKEYENLFYCEAEVLLDKLEMHIKKRSNAKNINVYKELSKIRNIKIVECE